MYFLHFFTLLESAVLGGGEAAAKVTEAAAQATPPPSGGFLGGIGVQGLLIYAVVLGGLYFIFIRPQKKRENEVKKMQSLLAVGDNVITSGGMYGVIAGVGEDCFIVEFGTNKGVRIPVRKVDILGLKAPTITPSKETGDGKDAK